MDIEAFKARRAAYSYPAVGLSGSIDSFQHKEFPTTLGLDEYHADLLASSKDHEVVLGYLSVLYWGHYSGKDKVARPERALGKVKLAALGKDRIRKGQRERMRGVADIGATTVARAVRTARASVLARSGGDALLHLAKFLPQMNFAFASKICAFLSPEHCGVIDSVIAAKYPRLGFSIDRGGYVRRNKQNACKYESYCRGLQAQAEAMNAEGSEYRWQDRDGALHSWRAVDVERALYSA